MIAVSLPLSMFYTHTDPSLCHSQNFQNLECIALKEPQMISKINVIRAETFQFDTRVLQWLANRLSDIGRESGAPGTRRHKCV